MRIIPVASAAITVLTETATVGGSDDVGFDAAMVTIGVEIVVGATRVVVDKLGCDNC